MSQVSHVISVLSVKCHKIKQRIAGQFGATFTSKYFPVVMYWNYIWLQNIIPPIHGTQVRSGRFKCGGGVVME